MTAPEVLKEELAAIEHLRWAGWQEYLHSVCISNDDGSLTIPASYVQRWRRQIATPYEELSHDEQQMDRIEVMKYLHLVQPATDHQMDAVLERVLRFLRGAMDIMDRQLPETRATHDKIRADCDRIERAFRRTP